MRCHRTYGIHHTVNPKGPAGRRYKPRGRKRPARASNAAIEATRFESRGIDRKPAASRAIASACDDEALRARGIRRPAQQNAYAGHGGNLDVVQASVTLRMFGKRPSL